MQPWVVSRAFMPELPEVEVVRRGIDRWAKGRTIESVQVLYPRSIRRSPGGQGMLVDALVGDAFRCASRRGKYLWLPLQATPDRALVVHLGMSGQVLMQPPKAADEKHLRVRVGFEDGRRQMRFVDQRTFGGVYLDELGAAGDNPRQSLPASILHIARDPLDPEFDEDEVIRRIRARGSEIKRVLLDQSVISGIGNIYADEALWRAGIGGTRPSNRLSRPTVAGLIGYTRQVMTEALAQGGTSFDSLYVNVNGESGYFDRSLDAYGREGEPCRRCGSPIRREPFMNRSSYRCPRCQRAGAPVRRRS